MKRLVTTLAVAGLLTAGACKAGHGSNTAPPGDTPAASSPSQAAGWQTVQVPVDLGPCKADPPGTYPGLTGWQIQGHYTVTNTLDRPVRQFDVSIRIVGDGGSVLVSDTAASDEAAGPVLPDQTLRGQSWGMGLPDQARGGVTCQVGEVRVLF